MSKDLFEGLRDILLWFWKRFLLGFKMLSGRSQGLSEALAILSLRVEFTQQSAPSPRPFWR